MKVVCSHCRTGYNLDDRYIRSTFARVRCARCHYVFSVYAMRPPTSDDACAQPSACEDLPAAQEDRRGVDPQTDAGTGNGGGAPPRGADPPRIIAVSNRKGGVAKTSTCLNLGLSLALLNKKVLLIDFDTQSNLTLSLGYKDTGSFYDVFYCEPGRVKKIIMKTRYPNLWLLPSNENLALLEGKHFGTVHFEHILRDWLVRIEADYDHILIDTPPAAGFFTLNALNAAGLALIPSVCEYLSANGANQIMKVIRRLKSGTNPELQWRILVTMHDPKDPSAQVVYSKLKANFGDLSFKTVIPFDTRMKESQIMKLPAIIYDKTCRCGLEYIALARELLNGSGACGQPIGAAYLKTLIE